MDAMVHDRGLEDIPPATLYRILGLRSAVFVVEQACVYLDPDGRDLEPAARGEGLAALLMEHFVATSSGPWVLDAQAHLAGWYERFGFEIVGDEYDDDGILHVPMRRDP
jgi:ElaA protein